MLEGDSSKQHVFSLNLDPKFPKKEKASCRVIEVQKEQHTFGVERSGNSAIFGFISGVAADSLGVAKETMFIEFQAWIDLRQSRAAEKIKPLLPVNRFETLEFPFL